MSLIISNRLTDKQRDFLHQLEYYGDYNLSVKQAAEIIDGLVEQRKQEAETDESLYSHDYVQFDGNYYDIF